MLVIAHRWQENLQKNAAMIEVDLRQRGKGIVLSHNRPGNTEKLLGLNQALNQINVPLNLELKESGFETEVLKAIQDFSPKVLISSKYPSILKKIRALDEKIELGLILGSANFFSLPFIPMLNRKLNLYSIHLKSFLGRASVIKYLHNLDKKVFVWTVNDEIEKSRFEKIGVDGIFSDKL